MLGHKAKGEESWFAIGPVRVEPAEFMKVGVVLMLAKFFHDDYQEGRPSYGLARIWKPILIAFIPVGCVLPDLGNAMMIALTALTILVFARLRWPLVAMGLIGLARRFGRHLERLRAGPVGRPPHPHPAGPEEASEPAHLRMVGPGSRLERVRATMRRNRKSRWGPAV